MAAPAAVAVLAKSGLIKWAVGAVVAVLAVLVAITAGGTVMVAFAFSQLTSGSAGIGDDYPWRGEPDEVHGGGLSPLGYYYRECVDFVAWRINQAAGTSAPPYATTWASLTPSGGDAYEWYAAWTQHGWPTSPTPVAGSVAWWAAGSVGSLGHVAWVTAVNPEGTVTIEEYNWGSQHTFGTRTIAVNAAAAAALGSTSKAPTAYLLPPSGGWPAIRH